MATKHQEHRTCAHGNCSQAREYWVVNGQGNKVTGYCREHGQLAARELPAAYYLVNEMGEIYGDKTEAVGTGGEVAGADHRSDAAQASADSGGDRERKRASYREPGTGGSDSSAHLALRDLPTGPPDRGAAGSGGAGEPGETALSLYSGAGERAVTAQQAAILLAPVEAGEVEIKPDGTVYLPWNKYARRLTAAFGPGGWTMVPLAKPMREGNTVIVHYALVAEGRYISEAVQGHPFYPTNRQGDWGDAVESAKSECLRRCCKVLGGTLELWDVGWRGEWIAEYSTRVWNPEKHAWWYRRKDRPAWGWEAKPGRASESEYDRSQNLDKENQAHIDAISGQDKSIMWEEWGGKGEPPDNLGREPGEEG